MTAENLAAALHTAANDSAMRQKAGLVGEQIQGEDGVGEAVAIIEDILRSL